jgi:hypothetical protein
VSERRLAPGYCTGPAVDGAYQRGFDLSAADWRAIFLAITDTIATDGKKSDRDDIAAEFAGPMRDSMERWTITLPKGRLDALYDPFRAVVYRVADSGRLPSAMSENPPPSSPPSRSGAASSVSVASAA